MFILLESHDEITRAQRALESTIRKAFATRRVRNIGYPSGTRHDAEVSTDGEYWYWAADHRGSEIPNPRRLNWFGHYHDEGGLEITVEINTPYEGRNDQIAGYFARHSRNGKTYLLHSGRVGGGTKGVGKTAFMAWTNQQLAEAVDSAGQIRIGILVSAVDGPDATSPLRRYIDTIARFKEAVRAGKLTTPEFQRRKQEYEAYFSEPRGRRRGRRHEHIDYVSRHGEVVDALHDWRVAQGLPEGCRVVKNVLMDMGLAQRGKVVEVYEAKTCTSRSDIYQAIGQLLVHGATNDCRKYMVLPDDGELTSDLADALGRLGIAVIRYHFAEGTVTVSR